MRQYHVKLHFHKQKGNYFAYDMWQWQDQVEGKSVSFSKLDYFGVEGNLIYESEEPLNRGHVLVKEGDWLTKTRDFEIELLPEGHVREVWILDGDDTVYYSLQAALTSHAYSHRQPHAYDMAMHPREFDANGRIKAGSVIGRKKGSIALNYGHQRLRKLNCCFINQLSWMHLFGRAFR